MNKSVLVFDATHYIELSAQQEYRFDGSLCMDEHGAYTYKVYGDEFFLNGRSLSERKNKIGSVTAVIFTEDEALYSPMENEVVRIGAAGREIIIPGTEVRAAIIGTGFVLEQGEVYRNGTLLTPGEHPFLNGDCLYIDGVKITRTGNLLCCSGRYVCSLKEHYEKPDILGGVPYMRSPRIVKQLPNETVDIQNPPTKEEKKKGIFLTVLTPLVMVCITVALGIIMKRGIMVLMSATMMVATTAFSVVRLIGEGREHKEKERKRVADYEIYLLGVRKRLYTLFSQQKEALRYHNPSLEQIALETHRLSGRLYERAALDGDFLNISVGRGTVVASYHIKYDGDTLKSTTDTDDELLQEMRDIARSFETLADMPIVVDLKKTHLALVGEKKNLHRQLEDIIAQLCFLQSYHDVEIFLFTDTASRPEFEWIRWYPHCRLSTIQVSGLVSSENQRDVVLGNITQILKLRKQNKDEQKKNSMFLPHFVFLIDEPKLVFSHSIMEYLQGDEMDLGFSVIFATHLKSNVPENIKTIVTVDGRERGTLLMKEGQFINQSLTLPVPHCTDLEFLSRQLCPIVHNKGVTTQIPDSITFFEMYGVREPEELPIRTLWQKNACHKSLAVPLGVRAKDDFVSLNLHEKAHGPHGLVAGTTGSGKSEALQAYILSLAVNFHPHDVGFLLIDYKGGGMAKLFEKLPHLLGMITNLDGSESMRALASIKNELARRQRIFNENGVNNINNYTKKFKAGEAQEPLPHLFLISDEFAELKKEQPEFMKELVSTARIGRSLGVHLILATQKPSGVVDDQIWSNSKFKLALKVANESDSNEVLKTPDAARITQSGRAYLQVGNNEIYELFQTAWSGAPYRDTKVQQTFDERIYLENEFGQGTLLNEDLSVGEKNDAVQQTQLDVAVEQIRKIYDETPCQPVMQPWLPPLGKQIVNPQIQTDHDVAEYAEQDLCALIGLLDIPEKQSQFDFCHNFFEDGNLAVFGAPGYGKSVFESNMMLSLAVKNSPALLHYYILDFGNSSLIPLKALPHTADYIGFDDAEKIQKFSKLITEEIRSRKKLFSASNVISFKMYNEIAEEKLRAIIIFIDNYNVIKEADPSLEDLLIKVSRDGIGVGIYTVISATRASAVRYSVLNNFKNKVVLFMYEQSDITSVVGRSPYPLQEIRGRALVKTDSVHTMQCYLPVPYSTDAEYIYCLRSVIGTIAEKNTAPVAEGIRVLPETLVGREFLMAAKKQPRAMAVGLDTDDVLPQYLSLAEPLYLIVGAPQTGKTNILRLLAEQAAATASLWVSDSKSGDLYPLSGQKNVHYTAHADSFSTFLKSLQTEVAERKEQYETLGGRMRLKDFFRTQPPALVLIDDGDGFIELCKVQEKETATLFSTAMEMGLTFVVTTTPAKMRGYDAVTKLLKDTQNGIVLGNPGEQTIFSVPIKRGYQARIDMGFLCSRGTARQIMIPLAQ